MSKLPKTMIILAVISLLVAMLIKLITAGKLIPGALPINWAKIADTFLLFSIALSLAGKK